MKVLITNPGDPVKRSGIYECSIWIELDGNNCTVKKNTNHGINKNDPHVFPLEELPQYIREEKILNECKPELAEIKIIESDITGATHKCQKTQHNPYPVKMNRDRHSL